jgi:putative DNA primase/helicase
MSDPKSLTPSNDRVNNIPIELRNLRRWINWRYGQRDGKHTKIPVAPWLGHKHPVSVTKESNLVLFKEAVEHASRSGFGIGYVFFVDDGIIGIDFDHKVNDDNGAIDEETLRDIKSLDSYTEFSPSGTGIHVIMKGSIQASFKNPEERIEVYDRDRYFTVTGAHIQNTPVTINENDVTLARFEKKYRKKRRKTPPLPNRVQLKHLNGYGWTLKDIRERDAKLDSLLSGVEVQGYTSASEADMAALSKLIFWGYTDSNAVEILRTFRGRKKLQRTGYIETTLANIDRSESIADKVDINDWSPQGGSQVFKQISTRLSVNPGNSELKDTYSATLPNLKATHISSAEENELRMLYTSVGIGMFQHSYRGKEGVTRRTSVKPDLLSAYIRRLHPIVTLRDNDDMYRYDWMSHRYLIDAETFIRETVKELLGQQFSKVVVDQVIYDIKATTGVNREDFVLDPNYIPVKNGLIYLKQQSNKKWSLELLPNSPEYYVVNRLPVDYNPAAQPVVWEPVINDVLKNDDVHFMQEFFGSTLVRKLLDHLALMLIGPTRTGKSTIIFVLQTMIGEDNSVEIALHDLQDTFERARLYKKMLCSHADISSKDLKESTRIKVLISGDRQSARRIYRESFEFKPFIKLVYSCNELPFSPEDTDAWYQRWKLMSVNQYQFFPGDPKTIPNLKETLTAPDELSGILNWSLDGLIRLLDQGKFTNRPTWEETRERWMLFGDPLTKFFESDWITWDGDGASPKGDLYSHFSAFCRSNGVTPDSKNKVGRKILRRYVNSSRLGEGWSNDKQAWIGLTLNKRKARL